MYKDLLEHIHIDYEYCPGILTEEFMVEEHGYVPNLDEYVSCFRKALPSSWESNTRLSITDENFNTVADPFFKNILVSVKVDRISEDEEDWYRGGYIISSPGEVVRDNKLCNPRISIEYRTSNSVGLKDRLSTMFSHELTHMYENFQRKRKKIDDFNKLYDRNYGTYATFSDETSPSVRKLKQFLYWTDDQEVNANIGSIKTNLKYFSAKDIANSRKVEQILENTPFYKNYTIIRSYVTSRFIEHTVTFKEKAVNNILNFMRQSYPDRKFNSMLDVEKFCVNRWYRCDRKIKDRLGKIFTDLYIQESSRGVRVDHPIVDEDRGWR